MKNRLTERDLSRIVRRVISEDSGDVSDLERKELSDKMMKDWIDLHYMDQVFNKEKNQPYRPFNLNGKLDYNKVYREYMESIDDELEDMGFPNGFNIPEDITRDEFEKLKGKWSRMMGNTGRKKINEMTYDLRTDIMDVIKDSNASNDEIISILNSIADEMSSSRRLRRDVENRFRGGMNEEEEYDEKEMDQHINWDIKDVDCEGSRFGKMSSMGVSYDEDDNPEVFIRYCKGDNEELDYLKRKARMEIESYLF